MGIFLWTEPRYLVPVTLILSIIQGYIGSKARDSSRAPYEGCHEWLLIGFKAEKHPKSWVLLWRGWGSWGSVCFSVGEYSLEAKQETVPTYPGNLFLILLKASGVHLRHEHPPLVIIKCPHAHSPLKSKLPRNLNQGWHHRVLIWARR